MLLRAGDRGERFTKSWLSVMLAAQVLSHLAADLIGEVTSCPDGHCCRGGLTVPRTSAWRGNDHLSVAWANRICHHLSPHPELCCHLPRATAGIHGACVSYLLLHNSVTHPQT